MSRKRTPHLVPGAVIKAAFELKGISLRNLASALEVSHSNLTKYFADQPMLGPEKQAQLYAELGFNRFGLVDASGKVLHLDVSGKLDALRCFLEYAGAGPSTQFLMTAIVLERQAGREVELYALTSVSAPELRFLIHFGQTGVATGLSPFALNNIVSWSKSKTKRVSAETYLRWKSKQPVSRQEFDLSVHGSDETWSDLIEDFGMRRGLSPQEACQLVPELEGKLSALEAKLRISERLKESSDREVFALRTELAAMKEDGRGKGSSARAGKLVPRVAEKKKG